MAGRSPSPRWRTLLAVAVVAILLVRSEDGNGEHREPRTRSWLVTTVATLVATAIVAGTILLIETWRDSKIDLDGADLRGATLSGADLTSASLVDADLEGAKLRGSKLAGADLTNANLREVDLSDADLGEVLSGPGAVEMPGAILVKANLSQGVLRNAYLDGVDFSGANLNGSDLSDLSGTRLDFSRAADLEGITMRNADIWGIDFRSMTLIGADFGGSRSPSARRFASPHRCRYDGPATRQLR